MLFIAQRKNTVMASLADGGCHSIRLTPFGGRSQKASIWSALHGMPFEQCQGYLAGNGHRLYLPGVHRFAQSDAHSPFGRGGFNAYGFCGADPINVTDVSGRFSVKMLDYLLGQYPTAKVLLPLLPDPRMLAPVNRSAADAVEAYMKTPMSKSRVYFSEEFLGNYADAYVKAKSDLPSGPAARWRAMADDTVRAGSEIRWSDNAREYLGIRPPGSSNRLRLGPLYSQRWSGANDWAYRQIEQFERVPAI